MMVAVFARLADKHEIKRRDQGGHGHGADDQGGEHPAGGPGDDILSGGPPPDGIPALDHEGRWDRPKPAEMIPVDEVKRVLGKYGVLGWNEKLSP